MTFVFPSTTTANIPSFATGVAPHQHAFTGWFMYLKEIDLISIPLLFVPRASNDELSNFGYEINDFIKAKPIDLKRESHSIIPKIMSDSSFTKFISLNTLKHSFNSLEGMNHQIKKVI